MPVNDSTMHSNDIVAPGFDVEDFDDPEGLQEEDECQGFFLRFQPKPHPYFEGKRVVAYRIYYDIPPFIDWNSSKSINDAFPPVKGHGRRQVPMGPVIDALDPLEKLQIVNWWRSMNPKEQFTTGKELSCFYKAYTKSNAKKDDEQQREVKRKLAENPETAEIAKRMKPGECFVHGMADKASVRKVGASTTASAKVLQGASKTKCRQKGEPPANSNQVYDRTTRKAMLSQQLRTESVNKATKKPQDDAFPGMVGASSMVCRTTSTPLKNGKLPKGKPLRDKPILEHYGNLPPNLVTSFQQACADNGVEWKHTPHEEQPPMAAAFKKKKRKMFRPIEEVNKMDEDDVKRGTCSFFSIDV